MFKKAQKMKESSGRDWIKGGRGRGACHAPALLVAGRRANPPIPCQEKRSSWAGGAQQWLSGLANGAGAVRMRVVLVVLQRWHGCLLRMSPQCSANSAVLSCVPAIVHAHVHAA